MRSESSLSVTAAPLFSLLSTTFLTMFRSIMSVLPSPFTSVLKRFCASAELPKTIPHTESTAEAVITEETAAVLIVCFKFPMINTPFLI